MIRSFMIIDDAGARRYPTRTWLIETRLAERRQGLCMDALRFETCGRKGIA